MDEAVLSVRDLCEFLLRSGSLDNRFGGGSDRMQEGARIHRRLQKEEGDDYRAEVTLSGTCERNGIIYTVRGRTDGLIVRDGQIIIDEIKSVSCPLEEITEDFDRAHWGQAMCYAFLYAADCLPDERKRITVRLRYVQADTLETKTFERDVSFEELEAFFLDLLDRYRRWADWKAEWRNVRGSSLKAMHFPFAEYRPGQRQFAAAVYRTIVSGGKLFCQAPTGIGKTISALFPSLKAMGEGCTEKIFYLTAKTVTRRVAQDAVDRIHAEGGRIKSVMLTAKEQICPMPEHECNPESCPFADGYYDRINDCLFSLLKKEDVFTRERMESAAREWNVCPYELALDLASWCDLIIGDYNHVFDPIACLKRFFPGGGDDVFLIDEAHNLVDRSREMYSAGLEKAEVLHLRRRAQKEGEKGLTRILGRLNTALLAVQRRCEEEGSPREEGRRTLILSRPPEELVSSVRRFSVECGEWLTKRIGGELRRSVLELSFAASFFLRVTEEYDERYATLVHTGPEGMAVRLCCLDASVFLERSMSLGRASVLFSATLSPLDYFRTVLGGGSEAKRLALPSPFDPSNLCLMVADRVSTLYGDRTSSRTQVAVLLHTLAAARQGHYLFFFPSYAYLRDVYEEYRTLFPDERTLVQSGDAQEREAFLQAFEQEEGALAGFCVLGGVFAEGVDLRGERLIGAAIVGVGLPQIGDGQELLRGYYEREHGRGFDYAYRFPGMNKVLQAAGRVIRGETEKGVVLLIDRRFSTPPYRALFPDHWSHARSVRDEDELHGELRRFWEDY